MLGHVAEVYHYTVLLHGMIREFAHISKFVPLPFVKDFINGIDLNQMFKPTEIDCLLKNVPCIFPQNELIA
jgi:hypothetical protein